MAVKFVFLRNVLFLLWCYFCKILTTRHTTRSELPASNFVLREPLFFAGIALHLSPPVANTTLADLFKLHVRIYPFVAVRASLRRRSGDERHDGVTDGRQAWSRRRSVEALHATVGADQIAPLLGVELGGNITFFQALRMSWSFD